ncbi:lipopolysaccharide biosynthesis protein [Streptacidiphilus sp. EB103A]|uniref:lipopolysaccharide biosynthesis protein n=1 Tax=Streptacidiphilus sp. EB103A TaxID=3156275 RepID=UPI003514CFCF
MGSGIRGVRRARGVERVPRSSAGVHHARPQDQVVRNSFFLMSSTATMAALGFLFWVVVARFYTPAQVGVATSLISATSLIAYLSLFGLNSTLIRFPAAPGARNAQITQAIGLVAVAACAVGSLYLLGLPWYGQKLLFVRDDPLTSVAFVGICVFAALNLLTDAVFVGERVPQYNVLVDGFIQGLTKLALPLALLDLGAFGILGATGGGYVVAVLASLFFMWRKLGFRFDFRPRRTPLVEQMGYSAASHVSSILNLAPIMAIPMVVLQRLGADAAGYYFIAFQMANLLNSVSYAIGEAVFAEVSYDESRFGELLRRSAAVVAAVQAPAAAVMAAGSGLLLQLFGGSYGVRAQPLLVVLSLGALAVALNTWASFALKLARRMTHLIVSNVVYAVVTIGLAVLWASRGLVWMGWAWDIGNLASGAYAALALFGGRAATPSTGRLPEPEPVLMEEDHR